MKKPNSPPGTMTEAHCEWLVGRGYFRKTGEHEFTATAGTMVIRFRPDLPGLPVSAQKED